MWNEIIRTVNLDGMYRCVKCDKDLEYAKEGVDFEYQNQTTNTRKVCLECLGHNSR